VSFAGLRLLAASRGKGVAEFGTARNTAAAGSLVSRCGEGRALSPDGSHVLPVMEASSTILPALLDYAFGVVCLALGKDNGVVRTEVLATTTPPIV
jgi:hypothetical protein